MAATPQQQLDAVNDAIARGGILGVKLPDGSEVRYGSLKELLAAQKDLAAQVELDSGIPIFLPISFGRPE